MMRADVQSFLTVKQKLQLLKLPAAKRKRLNGQMARKVRVQSRKRLREQRGLDGQPWEKRKGRSRRKMLRGYSKLLRARGTAAAGIVDIKTGAASSGARAHQDGIASTMTASKMAKIHGEPDYSAPATRTQAKSLKAEGYKRPRAKGKGKSKATIKWIVENLTVGQAGQILRSMRDAPDKQSWIIQLPARSFLGATEKEIEGMVQTVFNQTVNAKPRG
ncbi:MAG: phage virion morphogenesis protein [Cellvibrionaceae bacterium]